MEQTLKTIGSVIIGFAILAGLLVVAVLVLEGGIWLSAKVYPWLLALNGLALAFTVFVLLPSAIFPSTPRFAGGGMVLVSYVFGATLWVWSLLVTYSLWGGVGLTIGLLMAGLGVVPLAMLATLFNGIWSELGQLVLSLMLTFGTRVWGGVLLDRAARSAGRGRGTA